MSLDALYRRVRAGEIPARKVGRFYRFVPEEMAQVGRLAVAGVSQPVPRPVIVPDVAPVPTKVTASRPIRARKQGSAVSRLRAMDPYAPAS